MLGPFLCGLLSQAPLLPKLRGHFAEFLGNASPAGLRVLPPSTCVGFRYGYSMIYSGFSWHALYGLRYFLSLHITGLASARRSSLPCTSPACTGLPFPGSRFLHASPHFLSYSSTGFSTCCPSATRLRLALGPDLPGADQLYPGILGYSAWRIPTSISLLIPAFSLPDSPLLLPVQLLHVSNAPLPIIFSYNP